MTPHLGSRSHVTDQTHQRVEKPHLHIIWLNTGAGLLSKWPTLFISWYSEISHYRNIVKNIIRMSGPLPSLPLTKKCTLVYISHRTCHLNFEFCPTLVVQSGGCLAVCVQGVLVLGSNLVSAKPNFSVIWVVPCCRPAKLLFRFTKHQKHLSVFLHILRSGCYLSSLHPKKVLNGFIKYFWAISNQHLALSLTQCWNTGVHGTLFNSVYRAIIRDVYYIHI